MEAIAHEIHGYDVVALQEVCTNVVGYTAYTVLYTCRYGVKMILK